MGSIRASYPDRPGTRTHRLRRHVERSQLRALMGVSAMAPVTRQGLNNYNHTCIRSRMPSSLSDESTQNTKYSVA